MTHKRRIEVRIKDTELFFGKKSKDKKFRFYYQANFRQLLTELKLNKQKIQVP